MSNTATPRTDALIARLYPNTKTLEHSTRGTKWFGDLSRTLERELADVTACNLSNCNKLNRSNDARREAVRESARLRAALETVGNDCALILDGDDLGGMSDSELFGAIAATVRAALAGGA